MPVIKNNWKAGLLNRTVCMWIHTHSGTQRETEIPEYEALSGKWE